jgi:hypothetical protein
MFDERTLTPAKLSELERVRTYFRAAVAACTRPPLLILIGLLTTAVEVALRLGIEKEVLAVHLRTLADHVVNGTCPHLFAPHTFELKGMKKK